ncbi:MAG: hypothetical protein HY742_05650 [Deltaproteobacteria bacterium]|nr:hypothetical protein [Deltaproteobacteria bacterium]
MEALFLHHFYKRCNKKIVIGTYKTVVPGKCYRETLLSVAGSRGEATLTFLLLFSFSYIRGTSFIKSRSDYSVSPEAGEEKVLRYQGFHVSVFSGGLAC